MAKSLTKWNTNGDWNNTMLKVNNALILNNFI